MLNRRANYQECAVNPYILENLIVIEFGVRQPDYVHVYVFLAPDLLPANYE